MIKESGGLGGGRRGGSGSCTFDISMRTAESDESVSVCSCRCSNLGVGGREVFKVFRLIRVYVSSGSRCFVHLTYFFGFLVFAHTSNVPSNGRGAVRSLPLPPPPSPLPSRLNPPFFLVLPSSITRYARFMSENAKNAPWGVAGTRESCPCSNICVSLSSSMCLPIIITTIVAAGLCFLPHVTTVAGGARETGREVRRDALPTRGQTVFSEGVESRRLPARGHGDQQEQEDEEVLTPRGSRRGGVRDGECLSII